MKSSFETWLGTSGDTSRRQSLLVTAGVGGSLPRASAIWKFSAATVLRDSYLSSPTPGEPLRAAGGAG